jgi:hypothetical protein
MIRRLLLTGKRQHARRQIKCSNLFTEFTPTAAKVAGTTARIQQLRARVIQSDPQQALTNIPLQYRRRIIAARGTAEGRGHRLLID